VSADNALNYRHEVVEFLDGNHNTLCKFQTDSDPGFKVVEKFVSSIVGNPVTARSPESLSIRQIFAETPTTDFEAIIMKSTGMLANTPPIL
jgi:hypothetical protein